MIGADREQPAPISGLPPIRVLIVDDEALGRLRIHDLLRGEYGVDVAGEAADGEAAVKAIRELKPDLVFLDVQMPKKNGLDVVKEIGAGEDADDDLRDGLRPLRAPGVRRRGGRLSREAVRRRAIRAGVRARAADAGARGSSISRAASCSRCCARARRIRVSDPPGAAAAASAHYLERIAVEMHGQVRPIPVAQIDYISAAGPYAELHVGDRRYVIREAMQTLEERLDPESLHARAPLRDRAARSRGGAASRRRRRLRAADEGRGAAAREPVAARGARALAGAHAARLNPGRGWLVVVMEPLLSIHERDDTRSATRRSVCRSRPRALAALSALTFALHILVNRFSPYGFQRDEFLYMAMGRHLRLWRMDFPPFIAMLSEVERFVLGDSIVAIRFVPALAAGLLVLMAGADRERARRRQVRADPRGRSGCNQPTLSSHR